MTVFKCFASNGNIILNKSNTEILFKRFLRGRISHVIPLLNETENQTTLVAASQQGKIKFTQQPVDQNDWLLQRAEKLKTEKKDFKINLLRKQELKKKKAEGPPYLRELKNELNTANQFETLSNVVTPLWRVDYQKQLQIKYAKSRNVLKKLANNLKDKNVLLPTDKMGVPCALEYTRPSPILERYRNKDEFSIRQDVSGNSKTVGFFVGNLKDENVFCVEPDYLLNLKMEHVKVAKLFQQYIRESQYDACIDFKEGHWRNLLVRSNVEGDIMAAAIMHPQSLSKDELDNEKNKLKEYFATGPGSECDLKSLYFQACRHTRCTHEQAPFELLMGEPNIIETIGDLKIRISPETFLQINTPAAANLYDIVKCFANIKSDTTVLDVCSGAGTISLFLAKHISRAVGIELSSMGVKDAKYNADLNGIKNVTFYQGRAERLVPEIIPNLICSELVAIVNPARGGLAPSVIQALRECKFLKRIVYISCKPEGKASEGFVELCKPAGKDFKLGKPFVPTYAIPVDLFPLTNHYELVLIFERL